MKYPQIFLPAIVATILVLSFSLLGCGVGDQSPRRTVMVEGIVAIINKVISEEPSREYFILDSAGDIRVKIDESGSFLFAIVSGGGSELFFVDGDKYISVILPPLEDGETVRLKLRYESDTSFLTTESIEVDQNVSGVIPTLTSPTVLTPVLTPPAAGPIQTPNVLPPTPTATQVSSSPFDAQGNTSGFGIPSGLVGNITTGRRLYQQQCSSCHGELGVGWRFGRIKTRIAQAPMFLSIPDRDLSNITAFLNRSAQ